MRKIQLAHSYVKKTIRNFFDNLYNYGILFAFYDFVWWLFFFIRAPFTWWITSYAIKKKTEWLDNYITKKYIDIIRKFEQVNEISTQLIRKPIIWVYWGQGEANMPPLVKACYKQLNYYNRNVRLITNDNIGNFISISPIITQKVKTGQIGWANYSDIIRNTLLAKYGGLWLDSTVWVSGKIPIEKLMKLSLFTANAKEKTDGKSIRFWSSFEWNWSSWCLWSNCKGNIFYGFVSEMLQAIAINEKKWPDYVIQDYLFYYACRHFFLVRRQMNAINLHTEHKDSLALLMNYPFEENKYDELIKDNFVFKLRFRTPWKTKTTDGKCTFYGRILQGII